MYGQDSNSLTPTVFIQYQNAGTETIITQIFTNNVPVEFLDQSKFMVRKTKKRKGDSRKRPRISYIDAQQFQPLPPPVVPPPPLIQPTFERRGFQQMARLPCYRGSRPR